MYRYLEIKEQLLNDIRGLPANTKIISRTELCNKYQVTRTTIDRAINELVDEKYLYSINGSGTYISPEIEVRISPETVSWGVVLPDVRKDTYPEILRGIEDVAQGKNVNVVICNTDNDIQKEYEYIARLVMSSVKGLIIIPSIMNSSDIRAYELLRNNKVPFVFCNRGIDTIRDVHTISINNFYGGYIATNHLIEKGYGKIAYIANVSYKSSNERLFGYSAALSESSMPVISRFIAMDTRSVNQDDGYSAAIRMLTMQDRPDAFFCFNDRVAASVSHAVRDCGLRISSDVGVVGHDNSNICDSQAVKLTSVDYRHYEIGRKAAMILVNLIEGNTLFDSYVHIFQPEMVVRDSCKGKCP
jgi:DNA-binding LacI/PurR family transcriptional regulator